MNQQREIRFTVVRSRRKTLAVEIGPKGMIVRAPMGARDSEIRSFIAQNRGWIEAHLQKAEERQKAAAQVPKLTNGELHALADQALKIIPERVRFYAERIGVTYGRITIRNQRTKWGSCTSQGNLNFNCLLMLAPPEVLDSIVVHELCHRKVMNHSRAFYDEVLRVFPEYPKCQQWLKENGPLLMARME